ncbi:MAG: phosphatase PAP2 family protein [Deltaproteobacteria bacterium]|nr:phosphatase PAP2 family protein [Deltaproteobacteria bacterium]
MNRVKLRSRALVAAAALITQLSATRALRAERYRTDVGSDVALLSGAIALAIAASNTPSRRGNWGAWLPGEAAAQRNFSARASRISDLTLYTTLTTPLIAQLAPGADADTGRATLIYAQVIAIDAALTMLTKRLVGRPRPYTHSADPAVAAYAQAKGDGAYASFFSGHSSLAFAAAVSGSYLFAARSGDRAARASLWGMQLALASFTAGLRLRAGRHYLSDVVVGALVGSGLALGISFAHTDRAARPSISTASALAIAGGISFGALLSHLLPFSFAAPNGSGLRLGPLFADGVAGLALSLSPP